MFCKNCGTQLANDSNFCNNCGLPQKEGVQAFTPRCETCEILFNYLGSALFFKEKYQFFARAIGPNGEYTAGKSDVFKSDTTPFPEDHPTARAEHRKLIAILTRDGWDRTGPGPAREWWRDQFRRQIK